MWAISITYQFMTAAWWLITGSNFKTLTKMVPLNPPVPGADNRKEDAGTSQSESFRSGGLIRVQFPTGLEFSHPDANRWDGILIRAVMATLTLRVPCVAGADTQHLRAEPQYHVPQQSWEDGKRKEREKKRKREQWKWGKIDRVIEIRKEMERQRECFRAQRSSGSDSRTDK